MKWVQWWKYSRVIKTSTSKVMSCIWFPLQTSMSLACLWLKQDLHIIYLFRGLFHWSEQLSYFPHSTTYKKHPHHFLKIKKNYNGKELKPCPGLSIWGGDHKCLRSDSTCDADLKRCLDCSSIFLFSKVHFILVPNDFSCCNTEF